MTDSPDEGAVAASLRRMRDGGITPNRELGQNFLIDANMLEVVCDAARVDSDDIVLEVGGGLGILSAHLAQRAKHVHVVEVDGRLEGPLREALEPFDNVTIHFGDALELDLASLDPTPRKLVANLPYGIAAPLIIESIVSMPQCEMWVAMVQREVGERLASGPASKAYGIPSVLAQAACKVEIARQVSRNVFRPVPHVDSVIVRLERERPAASAAVRKLVHEAFAHRRKALAKSLSLAQGADRDIRERARAALAQMGLPEDVRAERLTAEQFATLAGLIEPSAQPDKDGQ